MELSELKDKIISTYQGTAERLEELLSAFDTDRAFFPFNEYEQPIVSMIADGGLTYEKYCTLRTQYMAQNPNLWLFEVSVPRKFGECFGQTFLQAACPQLLSPSKELDKDYHGQYDLWLDGIRIEVKASRVVDRDSDEPLYKKALSSNTSRPFVMNFQQLKPQCCEVFAWHAVFRDITAVWILSSEEVLTHPDYYTGQHRGNKGNERQLHITNNNIKALERYKVSDGNFAATIRAAAKRGKVTKS